jgi:exportin-2 (importin alpha re-exporter)
MVDPAALRLVLQETLSPYADKRRAGESHAGTFACGELGPKQRSDQSLLSSIISDVCAPLIFNISAEQLLSESQKVPGHPLAVLQLIESAAASDAAVRQAAAVHFKNIVKNGWDEGREVRNTMLTEFCKLHGTSSPLPFTLKFALWQDGTNGIIIAQNDRNTIKVHLVELMCTVPPQIQAQISESISLIAAVDYPKNWDNLVGELVQKMNSADLAVVNGVLKTANSIFKRFRYVDRGDELYTVILSTLQRIQEPLLVEFVRMGQAVEMFANDPAQLAPRLDALCSMCRIFYSLNYQDLPEFFEDHMAEWMGEFAKYLHYSNPALTDESEESEPSPVDLLQGAIVSKTCRCTLTRMRNPSSRSCRSLLLWFGICSSVWPPTQSTTR